VGDSHSCGTTVNRTGICWGDASNNRLAMPSGKLWHVSGLTLTLTHPPLEKNGWRSGDPRAASFLDAECQLLWRGAYLRRHYTGVMAPPCRPVVGKKSASECAPPVAPTLTTVFMQRQGDAHCWGDNSAGQTQVPTLWDPMEKWTVSSLLSPIPPQTLHRPVTCASPSSGLGGHCRRLHFLRGAHEWPRALLGRQPRECQGCHGRADGNLPRRLRGASPVPTPRPTLDHPQPEPPAEVLCDQGRRRAAQLLGARGPEAFLTYAAAAGGSSAAAASRQRALACSLRPASRENIHALVRPCRRTFP
jgi:hypothetical protein